MNFQRIARTNPNDWNDCTVTSISTCMGIEYQRVHEALTSEGRGLGKGLRWDIVSEFLRDNGFTLQSSCNISLKEALAIYSKGRYLFLVRDHLFAVIDGVIHDTSEPRTTMRILRVMRYL